MKCPICRLHEIADNLKTKEEIRHTCVEHHRKIYAEKVAPFVRIETPTPLEIEKQVDELRQELKRLKEELAKK